MFDIIGDIHGHATELEALLSKLGYDNSGGAWRHPERKVIFLGDFVDRGPEQIQTIEIARGMVESGGALAVMGNHEFNAVAYASPHPDRPGEFLRAHSDKNLDQHRAFLEQVGEGSALYRDTIAWFKTLPLYLELEEFRVIHACWYPVYLEIISRYLDDQNRIEADAWPELNRKGSEAFEALEVLLKGLEISLPRGKEFLDKDQRPRRSMRTKWWNLEGITYRDLAMVPEEAISSIPHEPMPADILPGYDERKPVFVGHYWMKGKPAPLNDHVACLDYSVVDRENGKLCAYRWGSEEQASGRLRQESFCWVPSGT